MHSIDAEHSPLVVGSLESDSVSPLSVDESECDIVELHLDGWSGKQSVKDFADLCSLPVLITARDSSEGGNGNLSRKTRESLLRDHFSVAQALDIEIANFKSMEELWIESKQLDLYRVASAHDFDKPFAYSEMEDKTLEAMDYGANVAKFAYMMHSKLDFNQGLELLNKFKDSPINISIMGMGQYGPESRLLFAKNGSLLNYGYLGEKETAPGQLAASDMKSVISSETGETDRSFVAA